MLIYHIQGLAAAYQPLSVCRVYPPTLYWGLKHLDVRVVPAIIGTTPADNQLLVAGAAPVARLRARALHAVQVGARIGVLGVRDRRVKPLTDRRLRQRA